MASNIDPLEYLQAALRDPRVTLKLRPGTAVCAPAPPEAHSL